MEKEFLNPVTVKDSFGVSAGMKVADFGSGSGEFALVLSKMVGEGGLISAIDVREEPLESLEEKVKDKGLENIEILRADLEVPGGTGLKDISQDVVLIINVLFQSKQKSDIIKEAHRVLKLNGKLVLVDWEEEGGELGPPKELRTDSKIMKDMVIKEGFKLSGTFDAGSLHYGMLFMKE